MLRRLVLAVPLLLGAVSISTAAVAARTDMSRPSDSLRSRVQALTDAHPHAAVSVSVIDPSTNTSMHLLGDRVFHAASTMKVPVLIEVYRQAYLGRFSLDDSIGVENRFRSIVDGSEYRIEDDSDDSLYEALGGRMTIRDLARRMITVSSNLAANLLIDLVSPDSIQRTIEAMGARKMRVLRGVEDLKAFEQGRNNTATAADLALLLDELRRGEGVSEDADREMVDVLLQQEFRDMIPAGLSRSAQVAHKTGRITGIFHDAAIVYPVDGPSYVVVVLTEGFADDDTAARLGAEIARVVHEELRPSDTR